MSSEADPFRAARAASVRRLVGVGMAVGALALVGVAVMVLRSGRGPLRPALPRGIVAQLRSASFASPVDAQTGYQRLASLLPRGATIDAAALAEDGTLAIALHAPDGRLLVVRPGELSAASLDGRRVSALAFTPESELYVGFDDGGLATLGARALASTAAVAERGAAPSSTVMGFAFDRATKKTAVLFAGGEVFTALRPFRAGALRAVTIPPNARAREALFTDDSELVLAGDRGQVFVSTGDAWDAVPLPTSGDVVALAIDLAGALLVAQSNGALFRRDGGWESLGQAPAAPLAIGELGGRGIVAVLSDGRVVGVTEARGAAESLAGYTPRGVALGGQIAGLNVLVLSRERLVVAEPGDAAAAWSSDAAEVADAGAVGADCRLIGDTSTRMLTRTSPLLVCGEAPMLLRGAALRPAPAFPVSGRTLPGSELLRLVQAGRQVSYVGGQLVRPHSAAEPPSLLVFHAQGLRYTPLVTLPPEEGRVRGWSAVAGEGGALELVTVSESGTVRLARVAPDAGGAMGEVAVVAELLASRGVLDGLALREELPEPLALGGGRVLLAYVGLPTLLARLDAASPERVEPVPVRGDPPGVVAGEEDWAATAFASVGSAWLARPGLLEHLGPTGDAERIASDVYLDLREGTLAVDASGHLRALAARALPRGPMVQVVLDCDAARCTERAFPASVDARGLFLADDGQLGILERDGTIGRFTR